MARSTIGALLLALALSHMPPVAHAASDVIAVVGLKQLEELVAKHPFLVAEFYAPWCGHCKKLEPEYAKAASELKGHDPSITLVKVDMDDKKNGDMKAKFGIRGFPTLKVFKGSLDSPAEYAGPREAAGIVKYLQKQVLPAYVQLGSKEAVQAAVKDADVLVLAYLANTDSPEFKTFAELADEMRAEMDFAYVTDHSLLEECSGSDCTSPAIVLYKRDEAEQARYAGEFSPALLKAWAAAKSLPLVVKFGSSPTPTATKAIQKVFTGTLPRLIAVAKKETPELMEQLQQASKANDELAVVLAIEGDGKRLIDHFGLKPEGELTLLIDDPKGPAKYLKAGLKPSDIPEFIREFQEGALEKWMKSEEPPKDNSGPVRVVTGKTFEAEVLKSGKDVFIEFYAPWCGHCKSLAPIWEEVGKELKNDAGVVIAKMDATANDIPSAAFVVKGFPSLYYVTAKGEVLAKYAGDRSKAALLKYVAEQRGKAAAVDEDEVDDGEEAEEAPKDEL